ncbi:MAG: hypothetical protein M1839_007560 [Geoglossum umbratile]|nr:MAG: hypothetical protein M1839_007560 [Geoglossum umbratile]
MRSLQLLVFCSTLLLLATFSSAWPWPPYDILKRQDSKTDSTSSNPGTSASATATATGKGTKTDSNSGSGTITGSNSGSAAPTGSTNGTKTTKSKTSDIDPRLPAGGILMLTPSALAAPSYYKIGDFVTFAWNYTSLVVTPSAIDVVASCQRNDQVYTIAANQSLNGTQGVTWDTGAYQSTATVPLLT